MLIQDYYPVIGGAERQLATLAPRLVELGISVTVYTRQAPGLPPTETLSGVPVHRLPVPGSRATRSLSFTVNVLNRLKTLRPDVIHAHNLFSPSTTAVLAKKLFDIPIIAKVVRGGHLGDLHQLRERALGRYRVNWLCRNVDRFVTISAEIGEELAKLGVTNERRAFIPNGVDCERFCPVTIEVKAGLRKKLKLPDALTVVYTGRLASEKRIEDIVSIWPSVRDKYPGASLLVVGTGEQAAVLRKMGTPGVIFTGPVDDVAPYLKAADIFVLPSVTEGLSNALLEAMASGLACIATDVGGARELITPGESGILIPPKNPSVLLEQLLKVLAKTEDRVPLGQKARAHVTEYFSLDFVARSIDRLYHDVLGRKLT